MLWIVKTAHEEVLLFKNKVVVVFDDDGDYERMEDVSGARIEADFEFCSSAFENVTGIKLPYDKPKKLLLTVR